MEETNSPYRNNKLFSHDFIEERLSTLAGWQISEEELKAVSERLCDLFDRALPATSEASLEEELIRPILSDVLGFSYLVQPSTSIFKTHRKPDYALFLTEEEKQAAKPFDGEKKLFESALAVADAKAWEVDLDTIGPASQMHDYILISNVRWGVITNGRRWRLYQRDTVHELDTFYEVDLEKIVAADDPSSLKYFLVFFRAQSFLRNSFLDRVLTESVEYARRVGAELKENFARGDYGTFALGRTGSRASKDHGPLSRRTFRLRLQRRATACYRLPPGSSRSRWGHFTSLSYVPGTETSSPFRSTSVRPNVRTCPAKAERFNVRSSRCSE